jgi:hypothetical protein
MTSGISSRASAGSTLGVGARADLSELFEAEGAIGFSAGVPEPPQPATCDDPTTHATTNE